VNETLSVPALVAAAADGDEAAWRDIVDRYTPLVASVAYTFRLTRTDIDDVAQTVWERLLQHLGDLREPRALPKWISTTTRNECLRVMRTGKRTRPYDPVGDGTVYDAVDNRTPAAEPDEELIRSGRHQALLAALAELPAHQRDLILLLIADPPLSYATISERLGIPVGAIGPTRARAIRRMRECPRIAEWRSETIDNGTEGGPGHDYAALGR
jgi:RNA polymerase sigma factor (sigma-70 family)